MEVSSSTQPTDGVADSASSHTVIRNLSRMLSGHLAKVLILGLSGTLVPRTLGAESYGLLAAVLAIVTMVQVLSTLGLVQTALRFLPPLWHRDRTAALRLGSTVWILRLSAAPLLGVLGVIWIGSTVGSGWSPQVLLALGLLCALVPATEAARCLFVPIDEVGKFVGIDLLYLCLRLPIVIGSYLTFGIWGVFFALATLQAIVWGLATFVLRRVFAVAPRHFQLSSLVPYLRFGLSTWTEAILGILQVQFGIYAVAIWATPRDAGILAVATMLFVIARGLLHAVFLAVAPGLAVIEADGDAERLRAWGELILGASTAVYSVLLVAWVTIGSQLVSWIFGPEFHLVFPAVTLLLACSIFIAIGSTCHRLLLIKRRPGTALATTTLYSLSILAGLFYVLPNGGPQIVVEIAWVYLGAGVLFAVTSSIALRVRGGLTLPFSSSTLFALPALVYIAATLWFETRESFVALGLASLVYLCFLAWLVSQRREQIRDIGLAIRRYLAPP